MKSSGFLALLLSASIPSSAFAQNFSALRAGTGAQSSVSGAAGTVRAVPSGAGALAPLSLSAPSIALGLTPAPGIAPSAASAEPMLAAPSAQAARPVASARLAAVQALTPSAPAVEHAAAALSEEASPRAREASAKPDAAKTWTERLTSWFDGSRRAPQSAGRPELDPTEIKVFLTRQGGDPMTADLRSLPAVLNANPGYLESLNKSGRVRLVVRQTRAGDRHAALDLPAIERAFKSSGVTATVSVEKLSVEKKKSPEQLAALQGAVKPVHPLRRFIIDPLTLPFRELPYLARSLKSSFTKPSWTEVLGGIAAEGAPFVLGFIWWSKLFLPDHPGVWLAAVSYSFAMNAFHGIFIDTWNNFQNRIERQRGFKYQVSFNLLYSQFTGALFRLLTWSVIAGTVPPWSPLYFMPIIGMAILGTFCGVLGYQGLNGLYNKGVLSRRARSGVQQVRTLLFVAGGIFFGAGSMDYFLPVFIVQQSIDILLYLISRRAAARSVAYVADASLAGTNEFQTMYPVKPGVEASPLKQALQAVTDNSLVKWLVSLAKASWRLVRKTPASPPSNPPA